MNQERRPGLDREEPELAYEDDIPIDHDDPDADELQVDERKAGS